MNQISDAQIFTPSGPRTEVSLTDLPAIPRLFATLVGLSLVRKSHLAPDLLLPDLGYTFEKWKMDPERVSRFKDLCGYGDSRAPEVPAPYIQTLFIGIIGRFISAPHFPITPMGLIQVGQAYTLYRPVSLDDTLDLSCSLLDMTQTPRGITTRFDLKAFTGGNLAWQGIASNFTRAKNPPPKQGAPPKKEAPLPVLETIRVSADTGRRYAALSGDYNPHHLYPWTAKLIGFKRAIAHGAWSLARACASLENRYGYPDSFTIEGAMKLPIFMPASVTLGLEQTDQATRFELRDKIKELPHLKGTFRF